VLRQIESSCFHSSSGDSAFPIEETGRLDDDDEDDDEHDRRPPPGD